MHPDGAEFVKARRSAYKLLRTATAEELVEAFRALGTLQEALSLIEAGRKETGKRTEAVIPGVGETA